MDIQRDAAFEALDANAQQVILNAAQAYKQRKHTAPPQQFSIRKPSSAVIAP